MLSPELISQIKQLQIKAGRLVTDALAGEYSSAFKGVGMEFDRVREYVPGDDTRTIDWNVTARMNQPYVKIFREEREMTLMLMVDVSASQSFGSCGSLKIEAAAEIAAVIAFLAIKNNDKVGLVIFSDHVESFIPAKKGRSHVWRIIRTILSHEAKGSKTDLAGVLKQFVQTNKRKTTAFLISDFISPQNYEKELRSAAKRHELTCIQVTDERETVFPDVGVVSLVDPESQEKVTVDLSHKSSVQAMTRSIQASQKDFEKRMMRYGVDTFQVKTHEPVVDPLVRYIRRRERKC